MLADIRNAVSAGMPCIAECGGFMYLHETLIDAEGSAHPMAGVIPGACRKADHLVRFGYASYTAAKDNLLCPAGDVIRGHEFHYWESDNPGSSFTALKPVSGKSWPCIEATETLCAGYPHFHFYSNPGAALRFLERSAQYQGAGI
jgi:cobyrinic acid a,c-diamide synthase